MAETSFKKISVIIPAYNEEKTIAELLERVKAVQVCGLDKEIIVVDDGSKDSTRSILEKAEGIRYVFHEKNKGKGGAVKTGIAAAAGDIIILQDADLEYDPSDYAVMVKPILENETSFVMGSRFLTQKIRFFIKDGSPFFSHYLGNKMIIALTNILYNQRNTDYEGCYKAFTKTLYDSTPVTTNDFDFDNELICKVLRRKQKIVEVPINYSPRLYSEGKKITWRHGVKMLLSIIKWRFARF